MNNDNNNINKRTAEAINEAPEFPLQTYQRTVELKNYGITNMEQNIDASASDPNGDTLTYGFSSSEGVTTEGNYSTQESSHGSLTINNTNGEISYETNNIIANVLPYSNGMDGNQVVDQFTIKVTDNGGSYHTATVEIKLVGKMCNNLSSCNYGSLGPCATNDCLGSCDGNAQKTGKVCYKVVTV